MLEELYQEEILRLAKSVLCSELENPTHIGSVSNSTCGDSCNVSLLVEQGNITKIGGVYSGCVIMKASAATMVSLLSSSRQNQGTAFINDVLDFLLGEKTEPPSQPLILFRQLHRYPVRVKCATLPWHAVQKALQNDWQNELKEKIIARLKTVYDPEVPVNIYDLGLIYDISTCKNGTAIITMTLTTPQCPVAQSFPDEVKRVVEKLPEVKEATIRLTFEPPWTKAYMSKHARRILSI